MKNRSVKNKKRRILMTKTRSKISKTRCKYMIVSGFRARNEEIKERIQQAERL
jgi:tRNA A37 threonylcarbamoyltransferase TsaD